VHQSIYTQLLSQVHQTNQVLDEGGLTRDCGQARPNPYVSEFDLEIWLPVSRRGDIVQAQTQRLSSMRDLLFGIFPDLEACLDLKISAIGRFDCAAADGGATGGGRCTCSPVT